MGNLILILLITLFSVSIIVLEMIRFDWKSNVYRPLELYRPLEPYKVLNEIYDILISTLIEKKDLNKIKKILNHKYYTLNFKTDGDYNKILSSLDEDYDSPECVFYILKHPKTEKILINHAVIYYVLLHGNDDENESLHKKYLKQLKPNDSNTYDFILYKIIKQKLPKLFKSAISNMKDDSDFEYHNNIVNQCFELELSDFIESLKLNKKMFGLVKKNHPKYYKSNILNKKIDNF